MSAKKVWLGIFSIWGILLSGVLNGVIGSPGIVQAVGLHQLLKQKQSQIAVLENQILHLSTQQSRLENSRVEQEREIRRVLGYIASDEIVFDFSSAERVGRP